MSSTDPMSPTDELLREAVAAYVAGRLGAAEVGYRRVLRKRPGDHLALYGMGLVSFHAGAKEQSIDYLLRSLVSKEDNGLAWNLLGTLHLETGKLVEAKIAFTRATELSPEICETWCNLAICLTRENDPQAAEAQLRRALNCPPPNSTAYEALTHMLCEQARLQEAASLVAAWVRHDPTHPIARHMAAAFSGQDPPSRASDDYVRRLFDVFAAEFDSTLKTLNYQGPQLVTTALRSAASGSAFSAVLDAGCGTGLSGPLVRQICRRLVGVDLSEKMLEQAQRRGCYDELVAAELSAFMRSRPQAFDAILSADTLVYFGELSEPLAAAHQALQPGGVLVFTLEALPESESADHRLGVSGRYSHSEAYLRGVLGEAGLGVESITRQTLRHERGAGVEGYLVVARHAKDHAP